MIDLIKNWLESEIYFKDKPDENHIPKRGMYLPEPHAEMIYTGEKKAILKFKYYNLENQRFLICDLHHAYCIATFTDAKIINNEDEFSDTQRLHKVTEEDMKKWDWTLPLFFYKVKTIKRFVHPLTINLPQGIQNFIKNPIQYIKIHGEEDLLLKRKQILLTDEEYSSIKEKYKNTPLSTSYYVDSRNGIAWAQFHLRGILPEDKEKFDKGELSFAKMIEKHSLHADLRWMLKGVKGIMECIILESDLKSYIRGFEGGLNPEQAGPANVQKVKVIGKIKPETEPRREVKSAAKTEKPIAGEVLLDKKSSELVDKLILHKNSFFLEPGDVGALPYTWAYLGTIWTGKISTGTERESLHELFFYPNNDLPDANKSLLNGRFIIRAFRGKAAKGGVTYWMWKATADPYPMNPWCHVDAGLHSILPEENIKIWDKEDDSRWKNRKDDCKG